MGLINTIKNKIAAKIAGLIILVGIIAGLGFLLAYNPFHWDIKLWGKSGLKIDDTKNVVEHIRTISEFTTACYYEEFVIKKEKYVTNEGSLLNKMKMLSDSTRNEIVLLTHGKVRAGFDMSKIKETDLKISADTITVNLPEPEIFDIIINPSDYEIFVEDGKWEHSEIQEMQKEAKERLLNNALQEGILHKANTVGENRVESLFRTFGFNVVNVVAGLSE